MWRKKCDIDTIEVVVLLEDVMCVREVESSNFNATKKVD
jgi:hypothetical protein